MSKVSIRSALMDPRLVQARTKEAQTIAETIVAWSETKPYSALLNSELLGELVEQDGIPDVVAKDSLEALMEGIRMVCGIPRDIVPPVALDGTLALPIAEAQGETASGVEPAEKKAEKARIGDLTLGTRIKYKRREATIVALPNEEGDLEAVIAYLAGEREEELVSVSEVVDVLEAPAEEAAIPSSNPTRFALLKQAESKARELAFNTGDDYGVLANLSVGALVGVPGEDGERLGWILEFHDRDEVEPGPVLLEEHRTRGQFTVDLFSVVRIAMTSEQEAEAAKQNLAQAKKSGMKNAVSLLDLELGTPIWYNDRPAFKRGAHHHPDKSKSRATIAYADGYRECIEVPVVEAVSKRKKKDPLPAPFEPDYPMPPVKNLDRDRVESLNYTIYGQDRGQLGNPYLVRFGETYVTYAEKIEVVVIFADETGAMGEAADGRRILLSCCRAAVEGEKTEAELVAECQAADGFVEVTSLRRGDHFEHLGKVYEFRSNPGGKVIHAREVREDGEKPRNVELSKSIRVKRRAPEPGSTTPEFPELPLQACQRCYGECVCEAYRDGEPPAIVTPDPVAIIYEESDPGDQGPAEEPTALVEPTMESPHVADVIPGSIEVTPGELVAALELMKIDLDSKESTLRVTESALKAANAGAENLRITVERQESELQAKDRLIESLTGKLDELNERIKELEARQPATVTLGGDMASLLRKLGSKA